MQPLSRLKVHNAVDQSSACSGLRAVDVEPSPSRQRNAERPGVGVRRDSLSACREASRVASHADDALSVVDSQLRAVRDSKLNADLIAGRLSRWSDEPLNASDSASVGDVDMGFIDSACCGLEVERPSDGVILHSLID